MAVLLIIILNYNELWVCELYQRYQQSILTAGEKLLGSYSGTARVFLGFCFQRVTGKENWTSEVESRETYDGDLILMYSVYSFYLLFSASFYFLT